MTQPSVAAAVATRRSAFAVTSAAILGTAITVGAPALPAVHSADGSPVGPPVASAVIVGAVIWVLGSVALVLATWRERADVVGAATAAVGAIGLGSLVSDLQLLSGAIDANRLELFRPLSAASLDAGVGSIAVLVGHAVVIGAGVAGATLLRRVADVRGDDELPVAGRVPALVATAMVAATLVLAVSFVLPPYTSTDAVFLAPPVVDSPLAIAVGSALSAVAVLAVGALALTAGSGSVAAAALTGTGVAASATMLTRWAAAGGAGDRIDADLGTRWGAPAALVLLVVGAVLPLALRRREATVRPVRAPGTVDVNRRHVVAAVVSIVSGVAVGASAVVDLLDLPDGDIPVVAGVRVALIVAVVTVAASVPVLFSEFAAAVRPALVLIVLAQFAVAAGVLQAVVLAVGIPGVGLGAGAYALMIGAAASLVAVAALAVAGASERDDIDTSDVVDRTPVVTAVPIAAAVVAALGIVLPLYSLGGEAAGSIGDLPWGYDVWGRVVLAGAVVVAAAVAVRSRPARGAALLAGASVGPALLAVGALVVESPEPVALLPGTAVCFVGALCLITAAVVLGRTRQ